MKSKWLLTVGMRNSYNEQIILHLEGDNVLALLQSAITRKKTFESFSHEFNILNSISLGIAGFEKSKLGINSEEILPLYLKKPQAQRQLEEKEKKDNK